MQDSRFQASLEAIQTNSESNLSTLRQLYRGQMIASAHSNELTYLLEYSLNDYRVYLLVEDIFV